MKTYTPCPTFETFIPLWLEFAGDPALLDEIIEHKSDCPVCMANMKNWRALEAEILNYPAFGDSTK